VIETLVARRKIAGALERPGDYVEPRGAGRASRTRRHDATFVVESENAGKRGAPDVDSGRFVAPQSPRSRGKHDVVEQHCLTAVFGLVLYPIIDVAPMERLQEHLARRHAGRA